jgi:ABC-type branched-subunit amino acid transport system permease subunit
LDLSSSILLAVVALMALNRLLFVWERWWEVRAPFWTLQLANLAAACALVAVGIPEMKARDLNVVNIVLAALLIVHILTNNRRLQETLREARGADSEQREELEAEILRRLKKDDSGSP